MIICSHIAVAWIWTPYWAPDQSASHLLASLVKLRQRQEVALSQSAGNY